MSKVAQDDVSVEELLAGATDRGSSLLDEMAREEEPGARRMLAAALEAEVGAYIEGQVDDQGHRLVVCNGHHQARQILTSCGAVQVQVPRANDKRVDESGKRKRFASRILPAWARRSPSVAEVLPLSLDPPVLG